jgi:hypothetical protein
MSYRGYVVGWCVSLHCVNPASVHGINGELLETLLLTFILYCIVCYLTPMFTWLVHRGSIFHLLVLHCFNRSQIAPLQLFSSYQKLLQDTNNVFGQGNGPLLNKLYWKTKIIALLCWQNHKKNLTVGLQEGEVNWMCQVDGVMVLKKWYCYRFQIKVGKLRNFLSNRISYNYGRLFNHYS